MVGLNKMNRFIMRLFGPVAFTKLFLKFLKVCSNNETCWGKCESWAIFCLFIQET